MIVESRIDGVRIEIAGHRTLLLADDLDTKICVHQTDGGLAIERDWRSFPYDSQRVVFLSLSEAAALAIELAKIVTVADKRMTESGDFGGDESQ